MKYNKIEWWGWQMASLCTDEVLSERKEIKSICFPVLPVRIYSSSCLTLLSFSLCPSSWKPEYGRNEYIIKRKLQFESSNFNCHHLSDSAVTVLSPFDLMPWQNQVSKTTRMDRMIPRHVQHQNKWKLFVCGLGNQLTQVVWMWCTMVRPKLMCSWWDLLTYHTTTPRL